MEQLQGLKLQISADEVAVNSTCWHVQGRDGARQGEGSHLLHHFLPDDLSQIDGKPVADNQDAQVPVGFRV